MSSFIYLTGSAFNLYKRGTVTISPAAAGTDVGADRLYDDDPGSPLIFGSIAADSYMRVQYNALTNPGFESLGLAGWTSGDTGTGTSVSTTTAGQFLSGSRGLKLSGSDSSNYGSRYQLVRAAAGEWRRERCWIKDGGGGGGGGEAKLFLQNLKTGNYYNGSAWASTRAAAVTQATTASFVEMSVSYQMESFEACRDDTVSLKWEIVNQFGAPRDIFVDDCLSVPGVTFASIHGHNYGAVIPLVQSSDDASSWTTRATMTVKKPAFFSPFSIIYAEYWQIKLSGTNDVAPYTGEAVLGQYQTSATPIRTGPVRSREIPAARMTSGSGRQSQYNASVDATESVNVTFTARTEAAARELSDALWLRSGNGRYGVALVPKDDETAIYYGRLPQRLSEPRPTKDSWEFSFDLMGDPFPTVGA